MQTILYVVDALRADHLSCYGYERRTSPNIDELSDESIVFSNAQAQSTWTRASAGAVLTGMYPPASGLETVRDMFPPDVPSLPGVLSSNGIKTLGVSAMGNVSTSFGFGSAFDEFIDVYKHPKLLERRQPVESEKMFQQFGEDSSVVNPTSADLNDFVVPWIRDHSDEDFFVMVWSIDPHDPYDPMDEFRVDSKQQNDDRVPGYYDLKTGSSMDEVAWIKDRYDDLIRQNDHYIGELCDSLRDIGIYDDTTILLTADHGEAFGEKNVFGHATNPIKEVSHVPLLLKLPENERNGERITDLVGHVDIFPTLAAICNGDVPDTVQGESLLDLTEDGSWGDRTLYSRTKLHEDAPEIVSVTTPDRKYISRREPRLRDILSVSTNPVEMRMTLSDVLDWIRGPEREFLYEIDEVGTESELAIDDDEETKRVLKGSIEQWLEQCETIDISTVYSKTEVDRRTKEQLEQMGYID